MTERILIHASRDAGFTLLEVLIALAILSGAVVILLESHYATMRLFADTQEAATVEMLMQQGTALAETEILSGEESGDCDFGELYPDYKYGYQARFLDDIELPGLLEVEFTLYGPYENREITFRVYDGVLIDDAGN